MYRYGPTQDTLTKFFNIFFGYPYILETSEKVLQKAQGTVITNKHTYTLANETSLLSIGETVSALTPVFPMVDVQDAQDCEYFIRGKEVITRTYTEEESVWGETTWGVNVYHGPTKLVEHYLNNNELVYRADIKYTTSSIISMKYLNRVVETLPLWLNLNILPTLNFDEAYSLWEDSAVVSQGSYHISEYKDFVDGYSGVSRWGSCIWGGTTYMGSGQQSNVKLFKHMGANI